MRFQSFSLLPSFLVALILVGIVECNHNYLWGGDQTAAPFVEEFFKYYRNSGVCIENFLTLFNKLMTPEERTHWSSIMDAEMRNKDNPKLKKEEKEKIEEDIEEAQKDLSAFIKDFVFDHDENVPILTTFAMSRGAFDIGDNAQEMYFKFYIFDGFRYSFTPNGKVQPKDMAKIVFMLKWQELVRFKGIVKGQVEKWKFINYWKGTELLQGKPDVYLCDLLAIAVNTSPHKKKQAEPAKTMGASASALSRIKTFAGSSSSSQKTAVEQSTAKEPPMTIRGGLSKMLRELNKDVKHTKLHSIVDRWEKLERYKHWKNMCTKGGLIDRVFPGENGRWIYVFVKFAQHFMSKDGFRIYEHMRQKFNDHEWTIVKRFIYPALEFYIHRGQQLFDASNLSEVPLLIMACYSQWEKGKLSKSNLEKMLSKEKENLKKARNPRKGLFFKSGAQQSVPPSNINEDDYLVLNNALTNFKPAWLDEPILMGNGQEHYASHFYEFDRLEASLFFTPVEQMDHHHVSVMLYAQNFWLDWSWLDLLTTLHPFDIGGPSDFDVRNSLSIAMEANFFAFTKDGEFYINSHYLNGLLQNDDPFPEYRYTYGHGQFDDNGDPTKHRQTFNKWLNQSWNAAKLSKTRFENEEKWQLRFGLEVLSRIFLRLLHIENNNMQLVLQNPEKFFSIIDGVARLLARILAQIERRTKEIEAVEQQQQHCPDYQAKIKEIEYDKNNKLNNKLNQLRNQRWHVIPEEMKAIDAKIKEIENHKNNILNQLHARQRQWIPRKMEAMEQFTSRFADRFAVLAAADACIERFDAFRHLWLFDGNAKFRTNFGQDLVNTIEFFKNKREEQIAKRGYYNYHNPGYANPMEDMICRFKIGHQLEAFLDSTPGEKALKKFYGTMDTKVWMYAEGRMEMLFATLAKRCYDNKVTYGSEKRKLEVAQYSVDKGRVSQLTAYILLSAIFHLNRVLRDTLLADTLNGTKEFLNMKFNWEFENHDPYRQSQKNKPAAGKSKEEEEAVNTINGFEMLRKLKNKLSELKYYIEESNKYFEEKGENRYPAEYERTEVNGLRGKALEQHKEVNKYEALDQTCVWLEHVGIVKECMNNVYMQMSMPMNKKHMKKLKKVGKKVIKAVLKGEKKHKKKKHHGRFEVEFGGDSSSDEGFFEELLDLSMERKHGKKKHRRHRKRHGFEVELEGDSSSDEGGLAVAIEGIAGDSSSDDEGSSNFLTGGGGGDSSDDEGGLVGQLLGDGQDSSNDINNNLFGDNNGFFSLFNNDDWAEQDSADWAETKVNQMDTLVAAIKEFGFGGGNFDFGGGGGGGGDAGGGGWFNFNDGDQNLLGGFNLLDAVFNNDWNLVANIGDALGFVWEQIGVEAVLNGIGWLAKVVGKGLWEAAGGAAGVVGGAASWIFSSDN